MGEYRTTTGNAPPLISKQRRRRLLVRLFVVIAVLIALGIAGIAIDVERYFRTAGYVTTEHYAEVRPPGTGIIAKILAHSGQQVASGDILVQLDDSEERASLDEAKSRVSQIEAETARRRAEIAELRRKHGDQIAIAELQLKDASTKLLRSKELVARGLKAASSLEDDKLREDLAQAALTSLLNQDQTIYDKELTVMALELEGRRDAVQRAEARCRAKEIRAPIAGQVLRYEFVIGELVGPERVLYDIFGGDQQVLKLRVAERYATRVASGQRYRARLASYRGLQNIWFDGEVQHLRNVIQAEGQSTYRVAYCTFDPQGFTVPPGTTAEAKIYYGRSCLWFYLFGLDL